MRKHQIIILLIAFASIAKQSYGQFERTEKVGFTIKDENYYGPFHQHIKDTLHETVSKVGIYLSAGFGGGIEYGIIASDALYSLTVAYKSHLLSITRGNSANWMAGGNDGESYQQTNYTGLLIGEARRSKHAMVSFSAGIAVANINCGMTPHTVYCDMQNIVSFPIEFKAFWLAENGIGAGVHFSESIISSSGFSPFYLGISVVTGYWNKRKT